MSDPLRPDIVQRLSIIKYLCGMAVEQSLKPEPLSLTSILTFHDSVELFLQLSAEQLDLQADKKTEFMKYWDIIDPALRKEKGTELSQKEAMRRLNNSRVAFKHHGTLPSRLAIDGFRASVTEFFQTNTPLVFGIQFSQISMMDLVKCEIAKRLLEESQSLAQSGDIREAITKVAVAFVALIDDYEYRKTEMIGHSPFRFGDCMTYLSSDYYDLGDFVNKLKESIETLQEGMKILSLNLDYKRYVRFRMLTPPLMRMAGGGFRTYWNPKNEPTIDTYTFCFDYVIESAIRLQDFDFDVEESRATRMQDIYRILN